MLYVKNREMRPAASLAVKILGRLKSTAFAHNGMLSSRQGRQRWKKLVLWSACAHSGSRSFLDDGYAGVMLGAHASLASAQ